MLIGGGLGINCRLSTDSELRPRRGQKSLGKSATTHKGKDRLVGNPVIPTLVCVHIEVFCCLGIYCVMGSLGVIQYRRVKFLFGIKLWFEYGSRTAELVGGKNCGLFMELGKSKDSMRAFPCSPCSQCLIQHLHYHLSCSIK